MSAIYLVIDGKQSGPYSPDQVRQFKAEGKITPATPAWTKGMGDWSTLGHVMPDSPPAPPGMPPAPPVPLATYTPPASVMSAGSLSLAPSQPIATPSAPVAQSPSAPPPPEKEKIGGCLMTAIILGALLLIAIPVALLAGIALGPIQTGIQKAHESMAMQQARTIDLLMFQYANDNNGDYPEGKTSTEVFQKLLDGKYVTDPGIFYLPMPGKAKALPGHKLTPQNVCYDFTAGVKQNSPDDIPLVFSTGYTVVYTADTLTLPDETRASPLKGMAVGYKNMSARFIKAEPNGTVSGLLPITFDPGDGKYQQLKP